MIGRGADATLRREPHLVGREAVLDELTALARSAASGSGSLVLLTGEAGIGKSSVARALSQRVRDRLLVTWGSCSADRSAPPFWPWRGIIDVSASHANASGADTAIGAQRFERLNELRDRLPRQRPRLHVIEDLQWADVASVLLLAHVGAAIGDTPIMVVATVRAGEPIGRRLERAIEEVRRLATVREIAPLPPAAIAQLAQHEGITPEPDLVGLVAARTGGNALFATELLRSLRTADTTTARHERIAGDVPARVSEMISHRLERLPEAVVDVVVTASVVGAEGDARTLASVCGSHVEAVVELLEQARAARLVDADAPGRWRFRHELVRDAVHASATDAVRARKHAAVLELLAANGATPPPVLAHHALAAQPLFDAERAVALAARAGEFVLAQHAYEEAVGWFREALAAAPADLAPRWRSELLVLRGEAHRQMGELEEAQHAFLEAAELGDDPALLARAALGYADPGADLGIAYRSDDPVTATLLERAIAAQPEADAPTMVHLETRLAAELYFSDRPARARELAGSALRRARKLRDQRALAAASAVMHDAFVVGQKTQAEQLRGSQELLDRARRSGSPSALLGAHRARVFDLLAAGDLPAMDAEILAFRRVAEPLRSPGYQWWPSLWSAMRALLEGRHSLAEERAFAAHALGNRAFPALAFINLSFLLFFLRREQGRLAELEQVTREYAASHADVPALRVALIFLLAEIGRSDEANAMLDAISERDLGALRDRNWPASWFQLARAAALVGNRDVAALLLDDGHRPTEHCVTVSLATVCLGATDLAVAWLLATVGEADAADERFAEAERVNARLGARSWLAQARADHAHLLLDRDGPGDRDAARGLADLAAAATADIGCAVLQPRLDALRARLDRDGASAGTVSPVSSAIFRRSGATWELTFAGRHVRLAHTRGLGDVAFLLARPGEPVSVLELQADAPTTGAARGAPALDDRARREIRERLRELDAEVADAEAVDDRARAAAARAQRQLLAEAVARDLGLGGRTRRIDDPVERARKTVSTRLRRTIKTIAQAHPELGRHLERSIDTGTWCAYRPAEPVTWTT